MQYFSAACNPMCCVASTRKTSTSDSAWFQKNSCCKTIALKKDDALTLLQNCFENTFLHQNSVWFQRGPSSATHFLKQNKIGW